MLATKFASWWPAALAFAAVPLLLTLALACSAPHEAPQFASVRELQAWAKGQGLYCRSDRRDGKVVHGVAVSTRPLTWEETNSLGLYPPGSARVSGGAGVVWAINCPARVGPVVVSPWWGECRAWGNILVTGDPALLDRLERGGP